MSSTPKYSIVVPCYNEAKNIPLVLERYREVLHRSDVELVLVDNGSTDESAIVLAALLPSFPFARSIRVEVNQGYGFGIVSGLRACRGEYLGWTHADMQTDPRDTIKAVELLESASNAQSTYVKGRRKGRPIFDNFFTVGMSIFETALLRTSIYDINAQPNFFHRSFFESWKNPPNDFSLDLYAYYRAKKSKLNMVRFDVLFPERIHGESHWNTSFRAKWKFIKRTLDFSFKLRKLLHDEG